MSEEIENVADATTESQDIQPQEQASTEVSQPQKSAQEINWERANEALRLQKQEIEELRYRLTEREKPQPVLEVDEFAELDQDDYLTVGKARALAEKMAEKKANEAAKRMVAEYAQQQSVVQDEVKARSRFEDYDYVVENFAIPMIKNDPALAHKIQTSKNPAETAYRLGKLSDQYEEYMTKQQTSPKAEKILKNVNRPLSGNAAGQPLRSQAESFSKMSKDEVWSQSQKFARGA
jgi:hypothetical protein